MEIIFESPVKEALQRALTPLVENGADDLYLVCAEYKSSESSLRTDFNGLNTAKEYADDPKKIVILMSFMSKQGLLSIRPELAGLLCYKNLAFLQLPPQLVQIVTTYQMLKKGEKKESTLGKFAFEIEMFEREVSILRHDLHYAEADPERMVLWLDRAQKAGFTGTEKEIIEKVRNWERKTAGRFEGKYLEGVFIDFQGTLVVDGKINQKIQKKIEELGSDKQFCIISDSDPKNVQTKLKGFGFTCPILSKFDLKGAELEVVIDDFPEEKFRKEYGIIPKKYIQV